MYLADFQICLRVHEPALYLRLCRTWDPLELEIRKRIPRRLSFGGVKKIVLELGPEEEPRSRYRVLLDVGLFHFRDFNPERYLLLESDEQQAQITQIVRASMMELAERFQAPIAWLIDYLAEAQRDA